MKSGSESRLRTLSDIGSWILGGVLVTLCVTSPTAAQIIPDRTLPTPSLTTTVGPTTTITGGTPSGQHLFHSFTTFSVPAGTTARFNHAPDLATLITRITGVDPSVIAGTLETQGRTDVFLINPNGIIFGPQAQLNVGGSFLASSADRVLFDNGTHFSALDPQAPPLLTVNAPIGLQYGSVPGEILVVGAGHHLQIDPDTLAVLTVDRPVGLQVNSGETLALLGGPVTLDGGNITASGGRVILTGVSDQGLVALTPDELGWTVDLSDVAQFEPVALLNASSILTSGNVLGAVQATGGGGGDVHIHGQFVDVLDGSSILATTFGPEPGLGVQLQATEELLLAGAQIDVDTGAVLFPSTVFAEVGLMSPGNAGTVTLAAPFIFVGDGAQLSTSTFGSGNGGDLMVRAGAIEIIGGTNAFGPSGLFLDVADFEATGTGGTLRLAADQLTIDRGATISANTFGLGNAGQILIQSGEVAIANTSPDFEPSAIVTQVEDSGNGGSIHIETDRLSILGGGRLGSDVFGFGNGGTITVVADTIRIEGTALDRNRSSTIASVTELDSSGNGGTINLLTRQLTLSNGGQIRTSTLSEGNAGAVEIEAQTINLAGIDDVPTGLFAAVEPGATGQGGLIRLQTEALTVQNGAQIVVGTAGPGNAQNLEILAQTIDLDGRNTLASSGLFANALVDTGDGGTIHLQTDTLQVRNGATISASNFPSFMVNQSPGQGAAGNVEIEAQALTLQTEGTITTSTFTGDRGNIVLDVAGGLVMLRDRSAITTNASNNATGGNITITSEFLIAFPNENSDITANAVFGQGGRIDITTQQIFGLQFREGLTPLSDITVSSAFGVDGEVNIELLTQDNTEPVPLPEAITTGADQVKVGCPADQGANLIATGRGGLPQDLAQWVQSPQLLPAFERGVPSIASAPPQLGDRTRATTQPNPVPVVEAQGWARTADGAVQLIPQPSAEPPPVGIVAQTCLGRNAG